MVTGLHCLSFSGEVDDRAGRAFLDDYDYMALLASSILALTSTCKSVKQ